MARIVPNPLNRFRRHDNHKPLHARWGDVSITVPTEGSWCQYDNPHKSAQRRIGYGPGYVPDGFRRTSASPSCDYEDEEEDDSTTANHRPSSRRMSTLDPRRLSMRLVRSKSSDGKQGPQQEQQQQRDARTEFAYKPIKQDYSTEVAEIASKRESRFRYIPASPQYLEELEIIGRGHGRGPRSQSVSTSSYGHLSHSGSPLRHVVDDEQSRRGRRSRAFPKRVLGSSTITGQGQRSGPSVERKNRYSTRCMTTVMVPDPEDMYG